MAPAMCLHLEQASNRLPPELSPLVGFCQDTLVPTALERWDAASKALLESQGHLDVLQSHQAKGTFPQAILKACSSFELKFYKDVCSPEILSEAKRKVEEAISSARKTMLESAMALRADEVANSTEFLEPSTFKRGVLEYIQEEIKPLVAAVPGIELLLWERTLKPFYEAVYQDIEVEVKRRSLVNALAADQKAKAKAARDQSAADARIGMDVDALDATVTETAKNAAGSEVSKRMKALQAQIEALQARVNNQTLVGKKPVPPPPPPPLPTTRTPSASKDKGSQKNRGSGNKGRTPGGKATKRPQKEQGKRAGGEKKRKTQ